MSLRQSKPFWILLSICRWSIAVVFVWAAVAILTHGSANQATIFTTFVGRSEVRRIIAILCEFALALGLLVLLSAFCGAIAFEATREMQHPCGCFGVPAMLEDPAIVRRHLWVGFGVNLVLMAVAYTLAVARRKREST